MGTKQVTTRTPIHTAGWTRQCLSSPQVGMELRLCSSNTNVPTNTRGNMSSLTKRQLRLEEMWSTINCLDTSMGPLLICTANTNKYPCYYYHIVVVFGEINIL